MKQEQRIVCITNKHLGNCVCYLPEMRHLSRFHNAQVDFVTKKVPPVQLFRDVDFISDVILLKRWQWVFWFNPIAHRLARRVRSGMYKRVYLIIPDRKQANRFKRLFQLWGVAPELVVNVKPYGSEAEHALPEFAYGPHDLEPPELTASQDEIARMQKRLRDEIDWNGEPVVQIHPGSIRSQRGKGGDGAGTDFKWWPIENWSAVIDGVLERLPGAKVVITGSGAEDTLARQIIAANGGERVY